jgi:hypothetical protein
MNPGEADLAEAPTLTLRILNQHLEVCIAHFAGELIEILEALGEHLAGD